MPRSTFRLHQSSRSIATPMHCKSADIRSLSEHPDAGAQVLLPPDTR